MGLIAASTVGIAAGASAGGTATGPGDVRPAVDLTLDQQAGAHVAAGGVFTYTLSAANAGPGEATGVTVTDSLPAGVELVGSSNDECGPAAVEVVCGPYRIAKGETHDVTLTVRAPALAGAITNTATVQAGKGQLERNTGNNSATTSIVVDAAPTPPTETSPPVVVHPPAPTPPPGQGATSSNLVESAPAAVEPATQQPPSPAAPPPAPAAAGTFNAVVAGTVTVNGIAQIPDQVFLLRSGDVVDVTAGTITLTTAGGSHGTFSAQPFAPRQLAAEGAAAAPADVPGVFTITQQPTGGALTTLTLVGGDFSACRNARVLAGASATPVRQLWGSAKGQFRTKGRYSTATVRGTVWFTQDRCDGSLTSVVESVVDVFDQSLRKTVSLGPGQSYLALPKRVLARQRAARRSQSPADVRRRGLVWGGKLYGSRAELERWLVSRGRTWQGFRRAHPGLAAAIASRH